VSDTPRTDKEIERISSQFDGDTDNSEYAMDQMGKHARTLERELAAVWRERSEFAKRIDKADADFAQRTAERDEARREACFARCNPWIPEHHLTVAAERGWDCFDAKEER
jgi:hypothetical protein